MAQEITQTCAVCENRLGVQWTDTHGYAACITCGLPYQIFFYDEDKKRVEKPMEIAIRPEWLPIGKRYWQETRHRVFPGCYDVGMSGGRSYSGATREDVMRWNDWMGAHKDELPAPKEA